jgi:dCTP deaminase
VRANAAHIEPEWEGHLTIHIVNTGVKPVRVYAGEGILQVVFYQGDGACSCSYADRDGKYQGQDEITLPKIIETGAAGGKE